MRRIFLAIFLVGLTAIDAFADDSCDPKSFKEDISYTRDIATNLAYIDKISESQRQDKQSSVGISFMDIASLSAANAQKASTTLEKLLDFRFSETDRMWLLVSRLNEHGKAAYISCLRNRRDNLSVVLSDSAAEDKQFFVVVHSHPTHVTEYSQKLLVRVKGGKLIGDVPGDIRPQASANLAIERDNLFEPIEVAISIGDDALYPPVHLPALPKMTFRTELREVTTERFGQNGGKNGQDHRHVQACIKILPDELDAMIVPDSLQVSVVPEQLHGGVIEEIKSERISDDVLQACATVDHFLVDNNGVEFGRLRITAKVLKAICKLENGACVR